MTHSDDDFRLRPTKVADGLKLPNAEERKKRFARAIARAEFGRFYWKEDPVERAGAAAKRNIVKARKG